MALGSSAPEIMLAVIEQLGDDFYSAVSAAQAAVPPLVSSKH